MPTGTTSSARRARARRQPWRRPPQFAEEVSGAAGDEAVLDGALAMAWTGVDLAADPQWRTRCAASRHG
ncbi:hypothetical protein ACFVZD_14625 [Streptomyces sp. NPDC058287]|uniref:hypothetical protein n=1 Tax=Streptomyces sp. NPDC058287 TaxID=3346423 RepID=UPI0036E8DCE3